MINISDINADDLTAIANKAAALQAAALSSLAGESPYVAFLRFGFTANAANAAVNALLASDGNPLAKASVEKAVLSDVIGKEACEDLKARGLIDAAESQLSKCLWAIPAWSDFAALKLSYAQDARVSYPRSGRPDDVKAATRDGFPPDDEIETRAKAALEFLRDPSRIAFIAEGMSDLRDSFEPEEVAALNDISVFVVADIARLTDDAILSIRAPYGIRLSLITKIAEIRDAIKKP